MKDKNNIKKIVSYSIISLFVIVSCFLAFVLNHRWIYYIDYDVNFSAIAVSCVAIIAASVLLSIAAKKIFKDGIRFKELMLISVLLPIICCGLNVPLLKNDFGKLFFAVEQGSPFYPLRVGDYNFDGTPDWRYKQKQEFHTEHSSSHDSQNVSIFSSVYVIAQGKGDLNKAFVVFEENSFIFDFSECKGMEEAQIFFSFDNQDIAKSTTVYLVEGETRKPLSIKHGDNGMFVDFKQMQNMNGVIKIEY